MQALWIRWVTVASWQWPPSSGVWQRCCHHNCNGPVCSKHVWSKITKTTSSGAHGNVTVRVYFGISWYTTILYHDIMYIYIIHPNIIIYVVDHYLTYHLQSFLFESPLINRTGSWRALDLAPPVATSYRRSDFHRFYVLLLMAEIRLTSW